jgi:glycerol-3-phosphate acyltransferase PlsY
VLDFLRLHVNGVKEAFIVFFGSFMRRHELTQLNGATYLLLGCMITSLLYRKEVVIAACTFVIVGDTFAAILGQNLKSPQIFKRKTVLGSVGFFGGCCIVGLMFYYFTHFMPVQTIILGALAATFLEALPLPLDDNFYVPIATGLVMSFL